MTKKISQPLEIFSSEGYWHCALTMEMSVAFFTPSQQSSETKFFSVNSSGLKVHSCGGLPPSHRGYVHGYMFYFTVI
jgi:hypothetical protein